MRIPIQLSCANSPSTPNGHGNGAVREEPAPASQETMIEFGTAHEVLFVVAQPLEFADRVLLESKDGSLHAEATVVAVQYNPERTVVAARFLKPVPHWIVK